MTHSVTRLDIVLPPVIQSLNARWESLSPTDKLVGLLEIHMTVELLAELHRRYAPDVQTAMERAAGDNVVRGVDFSRARVHQR